MRKKLSKRISPATGRELSEGGVKNMGSFIEERRKGVEGG